MHFILFLSHDCRLPAVVARPANAPANYRLGRQQIVDEQQVKAHDLGPMHYKCRCCQALHFMHEWHDGKAKFQQASCSHCCQHGKVVLPALKPTPPVLRSLICKQRPGFFAFLKNIRSYNCAFQMASSGEVFLHTCSCYQGTIVCSNTDSCGSCMMTAEANIIGMCMCRHQRQKQGTISDRSHDFWS